MTKTRNRALIALGVTVAYALLIALSNWLAQRSGGDDQSPWMIASGSLMAFLAIPVFSGILPIWLARRWRLDYAWWPAAGRWPFSLAVVCGYVFLLNFDAIRELAGGEFDAARFAVHFVSAMLFHVPYYLLFAVLLLRSVERQAGLIPALIVTSAAFSLYHLGQWHFFPDGTKPLWLALLFVAFLGDLIVYLITRSLMLVAIGHSVSGAVAMARAGTYFDQTGFLFYVAIAIVGAIFCWSVFDRNRRTNGPGEHGGAWLSLTPSKE